MDISSGIIGSVTPFSIVAKHIILVLNRSCQNVLSSFVPYPMEATLRRDIDKRGVGGLTAMDLCYISTNFFSQIVFVSFVLKCGSHFVSQKQLPISQIDSSLNA